MLFRIGIDGLGCLGKNRRRSLAPQGGAPRGAQGIVYDGDLAARAAAARAARPGTDRAARGGRSKGRASYAGGPQGSSRAHRLMWPPLVLAAISLLGLSGCERGAESPLPTDGSEGGSAVSQAPVLADAQQVLRLHGSTTIGEQLAPALIQAFFTAYDKEAEFPDNWTPGEVENEKYLDVKTSHPILPRRVWIRAHGSATGFEALEKGEADIAMSSRPIKVSELLRLLELGDMTDPRAQHLIALDGISVVVHEDNPVDALTLDQVRDIFQCKITDWKEVGGSPEPIRLYSRDTKSGTFDTFRAMVLGESPLCADAQRLESNHSLMEKVTAEIGAIGFTGLAYAEHAKPVAIRRCARDYVPTVFTVKTEDYPLTRRLYLFNLPQDAPLIVDEFLKFTQSDAGQRDVAKAGFVDLTLTLAPATDTVVPPPLGVSERARRLSTTFRFPEGGTDLEWRAKRDIERLADHIHKHGGEAVRLVGFADPRDGGDREQALARARKIAAELENIGVTLRDEQVFGIAEHSLAACDDQADLVARRRVEVWVD